MEGLRFIPGRRSAVPARRLALGFTLLTGTSIALGAPGDLDSSFGSGGISTTDVFTRADGYREYSEAVTVRTDGKVVLGGQYSGSGHFACLFNADGSPDDTFGRSGENCTWGFVNDDGHNRNSGFSDLIVTLQSEVIAAGERHNGSDTDFFLMKLRADGSAPDTDFGADHDGDSQYDGWIQFDGGHGDDQARSVAMDTQGLIAMAGYVQGPSDRDFGLVVLHNGGRNSIHGTGGLVTLDFGDGDDSAEAVLFQPDGKVIVAGTSLRAGESNNFALARFDANGNLDTTFGADYDSNGTPDGWISFDIGSASNDQLANIALLPDGDIVAGGTTTSAGNGTQDLAYVRFTSNGQAFQWAVLETPGSDEQAHSMVLRPDGKALVGGTRADGEAAFAQFDIASLQPDAGFGSGGYAHFRAETGNDTEVRGVALHPSGSAVAGGWSVDPADNQTMTALLARMEGSALSLMPDDFEFSSGSSIEAPANTDITSDPITVAGLGANSFVAAGTIGGDEMSINGGPWLQRSIQQVQDGDTIRLRVASGANPGDSDIETLQVGGYVPPDQLRLRLGPHRSDSFAVVVGGDGIADSVEDGAPNAGDGNDDGIADRVQANVASLPTGDGSYVTVTLADDRCPVGNLATGGESPDDPAYEFPLGTVAFEIDGCNSADITLLFHGTDSLDGYEYRKYGPTPATGFDPAQSEWYTMPGASFGTRTVNGQTVATASFTLRDNELGDDSPTDLLIVDQGGPADPLQPTAVPTLSAWAQLLLLALIGGGAFARVRKVPKS